MPWDKGCAAPPLEQLVDEFGDGLFSHGPVLVPGCGLGHDVRWLAERRISAHGVDLSPTAVEMARAATVAPLATFEQGDFLDPAWRDGRTYAAIWEHTCFCAIDPTLRVAYADAAAGLLNAGGYLTGVFYLQPRDPGEEGEGPPFQVSIAELDNLFFPWFERVFGRVPGKCHPGREGREWLAVYRKLPQRRVAG